jgi:EAL domain-containing protein (putative c-di-GMP-specific phosphodiesterase class I)/CheY-like chemotaxis protein
MKGIRVLVVDDEDSVVDVLRALIGSDPSLEFAGAASDAERGIELALRERPDVVLMDVRMPGGGGVRAVREITRRCPPTKVVALSAHEDADTKIRMIGAGAGAYVPKSGSTDEILRAIHRSITDDGRKSSPNDAARSVHRSLVERRGEQRARVQEALRSGAVTTSFQAIVEIESGRVVGMEAQPRIAMLPSRPYDAWSADAEAVGLLEDLEVAAFRSALKALRRLPVERFVEFEVSADTAVSTPFRRAITRSAATRLVLGFSELSPVHPRLEETLAPLRDRGVRLSVSDVGADIGSLDRVVRLSPEFVRIDPALTKDIDHDASRHAIVAAVAAWATEAGAGSIAEEVSSEAHLEELGRLGVCYVQGRQVGPPRHLAELRTTPKRGAGRAVKSDPRRADTPKHNASPPGTPREAR